MVEAYILGKVAPGTESDVLDELEMIAGVRDVEFVMGKYDFVARVNGEEDLKEFDDQTVSKIREMDDVIATETLILHDKNMLE